MKAVIVSNETHVLLTLVPDVSSSITTDKLLMSDVNNINIFCKNMYILTCFYKVIIVFMYILLVFFLFLISDNGKFS